ncbi:hypothetical protein BKA82DRAFT_995139 [Pisolithus tinctorius]|uniref:BTB domain-containing protein n=1 Tax=Pisolithus tinctorius Marx 270 TaxID=870435 RepID=A0A0C3KM10_PISTI|nr:hypothetical protein BKA82DRAFT_995139 [Pisolithus tinctorius]KIO10647.1 hypothetical protein M404DRAFT_995139 [Pisolithus tinctorius Marx 270]
MPTPVYASPPFNHGKADVILRSSDNVDFRVFRLFLSLSSSFFETLFDLPQPSEEEKSADTETKDGLPVLPVSEDSRTLDALLRFCYPCTLTENPPLNHFRDVIKVLEAAQKYSLDEVENTIRKALFNPTILEANPLRCFAIARQARMREETILSARYSLRTSLVPDWFEEIEMISSTDLLALWAYHQKCGKAAQKLQLSYSWIEGHYQSRVAAPWIFGETPGRTCGCPKSNTIKLFGQKHLVWWEEFMEATFQTLKEKPCAQTVYQAAEKNIEQVRRRNCQSCSPDIATVMKQFADLFAKKVEELVSEVELHFTY